ncbi:hypothetical protein E1218_14095 [Kribbella turkmenica]|uniref:Uncharacterized protein n=1 Tax=Kribbella turkmenica TaxID=2530375 RepID=A0A4R4X668_9ACTN|nr:hypothetical protein [Kribbella turkmenica]TDD25896.1 hypothetical protein E1218_14095 [Kribbella turkmenica]
MTIITAPTRSPAYLRPALYAGVLLTLVATVTPLVDFATADGIGDHVRSAYPDWPADDVAKDRMAITVYLMAVGILGLVGWMWTLAAVAGGKRSARAIGTTLFALGVTFHLTTLSVGGEAYSTIVPPLHGTIAALPSLAGLIVVVGLWRRRQR